jgi:hypothetical protein
MVETRFDYGGNFPLAKVANTSRDAKMRLAKRRQKIPLPDGQRSTSKADPSHFQPMTEGLQFIEVGLFIRAMALIK